ncbi:hypothetical protein BHE74_00004931 [Ensete ventricosum]|nr:hypothetical protein BHE74_00004931 [Ensete ventricosum]
MKCTGISGTGMVYERQQVPRELQIANKDLLVAFEAARSRKSGRERSWKSLERELAEKMKFIKDKVRNFVPYQCTELCSVCSERLHTKDNGPLHTEVPTSVYMTQLPFISRNRSQKLTKLELPSLLQAHYLL